MDTTLRRRQRHARRAVSEATATEGIVAATAPPTFRQPVAAPAVAVVAGLPVALGHVGQKLARRWCTRQPWKGHRCDHGTTRRDTPKSLLRS